jgi:hypothetical protein
MHGQEWKYDLKHKERNGMEGTGGQLWRCFGLLYNEIFGIQ